LVADTAPTTLRGTAFGLFNIACAGALLLASAIAGGLWDTVGPTATFLAGGLFATLASIGLVAYRPIPRRES
jgi:MFS family permease